MQTLLAFYLYVFLVVPLVCLIIAFFYIVGFFFAVRPAILDCDKGDEGPLVYYKHWPSIKGKRIYPIWIVIFALAFFYSSFILDFSIFLVQYTILSKNFWLGIAIILALLALFCSPILLDIFYPRIKEKNKNLGIYKLCKEFLKAKKQKICPIIEIVE